MSDYHGVRAEINWNDWGYANWTNDSITAFPALTCLTATWNPDMSAKYGKVSVRKRAIVKGCVAGTASTSTVLR